MALHYHFEYVKGWVEYIDIIPFKVQQIIQWKKTLWVCECMNIQSHAHISLSMNYIVSGYCNAAV